MENILKFKNEGKAITIKIYGEIGASWWDKSDEEDVVQDLEKLNTLLKENQDAATIDIYINSNGGSVFDGVAIYNMLKRHKAYKRVFIDGFACSIASVIAMCGNSITMPKTSMMMIHNAWTIAMGNSKEMRKVADDLDKINEVIKNAYKSKMSISEDELTQLMDDESYLTAEECYEKGLCTRVDDNIDVSEDVGLALNKMETLYQNKLDTLNALKNAIKDIEAEGEVETEKLETETGETEEVIEPVEETGQPVEVIENEEVKDAETEAKDKVSEIKENALKRFFNLKEGE